MFGGWIVSESWRSVCNKSSTSEQVSSFETLLNEKLNIYCPQKVLKLGSQVKPFITTKLQTLKCQNMREYRKNGKSLKYHSLVAEFKELYSREAKRYLDDSLSTSFFIF